MNTNIHNLIKNEYDKKVLQAYHKQQENIKLVYSKVPQIEEIDYKIKRLGVRYNLKIISESNTNILTKLNDEICLLKDQKHDLLIKNGFSHDFLDIHFECSNCKDTGYIQNGFKTSKCSCYKQKYINYIYGQSNLSIIDKENFKTFNELYFSNDINTQKYKSNISPRENILKIKDLSINFIKNFNNPKTKNLFFTGNAGVGKTFMLNCIAKELIDAEKTVIYQTSSNLFNILNQYKLNYNINANMSEYEQIFNVELLIIDDLGIEPQSAAKYAELLNILNKRQIASLKTIISTNLSIRDIYNQYTERVSSRIIENFEILKFIGDDIRLIKNT